MMPLFKNVMYCRPDIASYVTRKEMQSARKQRNWSASDVARAASFVRILSGTLARREVEAELAEARDEATSAVDRAESAEARSEKLDSRANESDEKFAALTSEAV